MATGQEESSVSTPWTSSPAPPTSAISSPSSRVIPAAQHGASRILRREVRATANRLANFDDANLRRSARAAVGRTSRRCARPSPWT